MPKVSVVIPTHNRASFLQAAIQSVLNQTFQDFEVIVVDDASEDQTAEVVRRFSEPRIWYIRHEINKGQGASRNDGIRRASGEYIALLDDDDEWLPEKLAKQVALLDSSSSQVGMIYTWYSQIDASSKRVIGRVIPEKRGRVFEELCLNNWIGTCSTVLVRRVCFETVGVFDEELAAGADYDMWLRIAKEFDIDYIREPLVLYNVHGNRISTNYDSMIRGMEAMSEKYDQLFTLNSRNYSYYYLSLGVLYCYTGDIRKGRKCLFKAIRLYPFEIRHYFNICLSFLGAYHFRKIKELKEKWQVGRTTPL